jgi:hypothetical protein
VGVVGLGKHRAVGAHIAAMLARVDLGEIRCVLQLGPRLGLPHPAAVEGFGAVGEQLRGLDDQRDLRAAQFAMGSVRMPPI